MFAERSILLSESEYRLLRTNYYLVVTVDRTTYCLITAILAIYNWCRQTFRHLIYYLWSQVSTLLICYLHIIDNLWTQIFGLPYLVGTAQYGANAAAGTLRQLHGHFEGIARAQAESEDQRRRDHNGLRSELENLSRTLRTQQRNTTWFAENISHQLDRDRATHNRIQADINNIRARTTILVRDNNNIRDAIYEIRYIVGEGANEPLENRGRPQRRETTRNQQEEPQQTNWDEIFLYSDEEDSDVEREEEARANQLRELPSPDTSSTLYNDYSGNEALDPNSPPGSPRSLEGEQEAPPEILQETESNNEPSIPLTEENLIRQAIGYATRRAIRREVWGDSSENSWYPDTSDSESESSTSSHYTSLFTNN